MRSADPWVVSGRFQTERSPPFNSSWTQQQLDADLPPGAQGRGRAVTLVSAAGRVRTDRDSGRRGLRLQRQVSRRRRSDCGRVLPGGDCGSGGFLSTTTFAVDSEGLPFTPIDAAHEIDALPPAAPRLRESGSADQAPRGSGRGAGLGLACAAFFAGVGVHRDRPGRDVDDIGGLVASTSRRSACTSARPWRVVRMTRWYSGWPSRSITTLGRCRRMIAKSSPPADFQRAHRDDAAQVGAGARDAAQPRPRVIRELHLRDRRPLDRHIPLVECQRALGTRQHDLELRRVEQQGDHAPSLPAAPPRAPGDLLTDGQRSREPPRGRATVQDWNGDPARTRASRRRIGDRRRARASRRGRAPGRRRRRGAARRRGRAVRADAASSPAPCAMPGWRHPVAPA